MFIFTSLWYPFLIFHHLYTLSFPILLPSPNMEDAEVAQLVYFGPLYISIWNMVLQIIYLKLALVLNFIDYLPEKIKRHESQLRKTKGFIFVTFVFPITIYVVFVFWASRYMDIRLVPSLGLKLIPSWIDHAFHTNVLIFVLVEIFLENRFMVPTFKEALKALSIFTATYYSILLGVYFVFGKWPYVLLDDLNWKGRIMVLILTYIFNVALIKMGLESINKIGTISRGKIE